MKNKSIHYQSSAPTPILEINGRSDIGGGPKNMYRLLKGIVKKKFDKQNFSGRMVWWMVRRGFTRKPN